MTPATDLDALTRSEAASLLGWWLEAGVDGAVSEEARDWRAPAAAPPPAAELEAHPSPAPARAPAVSRTPAPLERGERPPSLDDYHAWLASSADLPLFRAGAARALPHGPAGAEVMLVAGIPQGEDIAEGRPIGGTAWALTVRMLAAIGIAPEAAYVTALTCFSAGGTRFTDAETATCREDLLHQIALVAPKRLLLLGDAPARLLLGQPMARARGKVHQVAGRPAVASFAPRHLLERSEDKRLAWADLLLLMGTDR